MGLDEDTFSQFQTLINKPHGILLVTGPTGSGKTTTLYSALSEITNNGENKLDIVGFDACLMSTIEVVEAVAPYSDIMIGSEILEPGDGWDYSFLQLIVDNPSTTPEQLGAKIVDTFVAQGQTSEQSYALTMLDMSKANLAINSINALAELKDTTSLISDLEAIRYDSVHVEPGDSSSAVDLLHLLTSLSEYTTDSNCLLYTSPSPRDATL